MDDKYTKKNEALKDFNTEDQTMKKNKQPRGVMKSNLQSCSSKLPT